MNTKKYYLLLLLFISLNIVKAYAQQDVSLPLPVVSVDFETECLQALSESQIEFDSLSDGIHRKAAWFSKDKAPGHLVFPESQV